MTTEPTPTYAGFARLYWMFIGPVLSTLFAYQIVMQGGGWSTRADLAFVLALVALPITRWAEFRGGNPQTADGAPATPEHLRRYVAAALFIGGIAWILANAVGSYRAV